MPYGVEGEVYIPVDKYGRIICRNDDGVRFTPWWVDGESPAWFDDAADQVLVNAMSEHGYVDALQSDGDPTHPWTISLEDETEVITWNNATKDFNVNIPLWQNGTANMFYRTVHVNDRDLTVLCDADGKAIRAPFGTWQTAVFTVGNNGTEIDSITEGSTIAIADVITACGGATDVDNVSGGKSVELLVNGNYVQFVNADNTTTTPSVTPWGYLPGLIARVVANENTLDPPSGEVSSAKLILYKNITEDTILENETAKLSFTYDSYDNVISLQWGDKQMSSFLFEAVENTQYPLAKGVYSLLDSEPDNVTGWGYLFYNN